jgi:hypothetical protein
MVVGMFVPGATRRPVWGLGQAAQRCKRQDNRLAKPQIVTALGICSPQPNLNQSAN